MTGNNDQSRVGKVTAEEIRRVWGDHLQPVPPELVSPRLSVPTREFLSTVGLPAVETVDSAGLIPVRNLRLSFRQEDCEYIVVAEDIDPGCGVAVEVATDQVFFICAEDPSDRRLVNSDIALFVLLQGLFQTTVRELAGADRDIGERLLADRWHQSTIRDPMAMKDDRNYWVGMWDNLADDFACGTP
ncbi:SUKH-4 family immunity protein [Nocardia pseudovaccinii]|uniref:SUKH-4 family immunity protein n=1 Tax=Nocardia pseudovaccinii TaxID=189540 RepID=UPI0007A3A42C|nr:SUKH-4 family immunity protein [Nocardia pseudovaccinii]